MAEHKAARTLKMADKLRVADWMRANKERLVTERPKMDVAAGWASEELGLQVSYNSIDTIRRALEIHWRPALPVTIKRAAPAPAFITTVGPWIHSSARQLVIARAVEKLYARLGEEIPGDLASAIEALVANTKADLRRAANRLPSA